MMSEKDNQTQVEKAVAHKDKILIVDDDEISIKLLSTILAENNC